MIGSQHDNRALFHNESGGGVDMKFSKLVVLLRRAVPIKLSHWHLAGLAIASALFGFNATAQPAEQLYTVLNPIGNPPPIERRAMAPRPQSLDGKTIYLVDVTFNGGDLFLKEMQKWLQANMPEVTAVYRVKKGAYSTDDPDLWKEIQAVDGVMVMAIGH
jgi:hypothetical protein